jgi:hypothetical protein
MYRPAVVEGEGTACGVEPSFGDVRYIAEPIMSANPRNNEEEFT